MRGKERGVRSINGRYLQNRQGSLRIVWEMEKPKNLLYMTHGPELRWENDGGGGTRQRGIKGRKKWDNSNSIINEIYFKNYKDCECLPFSSQRIKIDGSCKKKQTVNI